MASKKNQHSYGVVPIYYGDLGVEVLLVQSSKWNHWGFPKGSPKLGESNIGTTIREFTEETGLAIDDFQINFEINFDEEYEFEEEGKKCKKINTFYLGEVFEKWTGELAPDIMDVKWVTTDEVADNLTYKTTYDLFENFRNYIEL